MKLLFDQNMSPRLVNRLSNFYPNSVHVETVGLDRAVDKVVWDYARQNNYIIVTKDVDFSELSLLFGFPPKVIWIRRGNCSTKEIGNDTAVELRFHRGFEQRSGRPRSRGSTKR